jgi:hypothetical protein
MGSPHRSVVLNRTSQADYTRVDILPIDHDLWRFYHLHP